MAETKQQIAQKLTQQAGEKLKTFMATHYDPTDESQTRKGGGGVGAFNKPVQFGDVAMGLRKYKQGTLIEIPELKDVKTPYGDGVFRVNDKKNARYNKGNDSFDIAVSSSLPNAEELRKRIGNNTFHFKIVENKPMVNTTKKLPALGNSMSTNTARTSTTPSQPPTAKRNALMGLLSRGQSGQPVKQETKPVLSAGLDKLKSVGQKVMSAVSNVNPLSTKNMLQNSKQYGSDWYKKNKVKVDKDLAK